MPASVSLAEEELVPTTGSLIDPQPYLEAMGPILFDRSFTIPEEEVASFKDSITFGLTVRGQERGVEADGGLVMLDIKVTEVYAAKEDGCCALWSCGGLCNDLANKAVD